MMKSIQKLAAILFFLTLFFQSNAFSKDFSLQLSQNNFNSEQKIRLNDFLKTAETLLPPSLKNKLEKRIPVQFVNWNAEPELPLPSCTGKPTSVKKIRYGRSSFRGIEINSLFIDPILNGPENARTYPCGHGNLYRLALATLIHEIAHLYDFSSFTLGKGIVSSDRYYRKATGWIHRRHASHLFFPHLEHSNVHPTRSPNLNEYSNVKEHFAINMEYFLLDPEYACQRPTENEFLYQHFDNFDPFPDSTCKINTTAFFHFLNSSSKMGTPVDLDPDRIYEVHSLLASGGNQLSNKWGHFMFRLIICKPGRERGPECLQDISHHAVIDYRFHKQDSTHSFWKALTGGYSAQAFLYPFKEVIREYNDKFRDLTSLPIRLTNLEKKRFIYKFLENYWDYQGQYFFFSNNCATEAARLLKAAIRDDSMHSFNPSTPKEVEEELIDIGLVNELQLRDIKIAIQKQERLHEVLLKKAKQNALDPKEKLVSNMMNYVVQSGHFFPSTQGTLELAFATIQANAFEKKIPFPWNTLSEYIEGSTPYERAEFSSKIKDRPESGNLRRIFAGLYSIEAIIRFQKQTLLERRAFFTLEKRAHLAQRVPPEDRTPDQQEDLEVYEELIESTKKVRPTLTATDYSIPVGAELPMLDSSASTSVPKTKDWVQKHFANETARNKMIQTNMDAFMKGILESKQQELL